MLKDRISDRPGDAAKQNQRPRGADPEDRRKENADERQGGAEVRLQHHECHGRTHEGHRLHQLPKMFRSVRLPRQQLRQGERSGDLRRLPGLELEAGDRKEAPHTLGGPGPRANRQRNAQHAQGKHI